MNLPFQLPELKEGAGKERTSALTRQDKSALRFVARHLAMGLGAGALFGLAILASDLASLRSLAFNSEAPWLAVFLPFFGLFITFGATRWGRLRGRLSGAGGSFQLRRISSGL